MNSAFGSIPATSRRVPHTPDFLCSLVASLHFMRLSFKKGAHAVLSRAANRKFGASRSFFARCGIPQVSPSSLLRASQICTGAPCSHQRTWAENDGRSPTAASCSELTALPLSSRPERSGEPALSEVEGDLRFFLFLAPARPLEG